MGNEGMREFRDGLRVAGWRFAMVGLGDDYGGEGRVFITNWVSGYSREWEDAFNRDIKQSFIFK